jgi:hypothetical protein
MSKMSVHETATKAVAYLSPIDELGQRDIPVVSEGMERLEARCSILEFETQKVPVGRRSTTTKLDREGRCVIRYCNTVHINMYQCQRTIIKLTDTFKLGMAFD